MSGLAIGIFKLDNLLQAQISQGLQGGYDSDAEGLATQANLGGFSEKAVSIIHYYYIQFIHSGKATHHLAICTF